MKRMLIRYKTKPERTAENARLVQHVFEQLHASSPDGFRYATLQLADGTFLHIVTEDEVVDGRRFSLRELTAFQAFQHGIDDRCAEPPRVGEVSIVGNYRLLGE